MRLAFDVEGIPKTKGSMRSWLNKRTGRIVTHNDDPRTAAWERRVHLEAVAAARRAALRPFSGAVVVSLTFRLPRPPSSVRRDGTPRARAEPWPLKKRSGDLDKLQRPVLDALTGIAWSDDAQVVGVAATKEWATRERRAGVEVVVTEAADVVTEGAA